MNDLYALQLEREKQSQTAGYEKLQKETDWNNKTGNASNNDFGLFVKKYLLGEVVDKVEELTAQTVGSRTVEIKGILSKCLKAMPDGSTSDFFEADKAAFLAIQKTLDTALCPNTIDRLEQGKHGGDKRLLQKKTLSQLETHIGEIIQKQMSLSYIQQTFPAWFRKTSAQAEKQNEDGGKATTSYYDYRMEKAMKDFADYLRSKGEITEAEIVENRKCWTRRECSVIGSLILKCVFDVVGDYITVIDDVKMGKRGRPVKVKQVVLTELGKQKEKSILEFVSKYAHDVLPMLITPEPVTNECGGGWINETLKEKNTSFTGSFHLSDKHMEFINRQARRPFQVNPFIYQLLQKLYEEKKPLGKFKVYKLDEVPDVSDLLGLSAMGKSPEQTAAMRNHPDYHKTKKEVSRLHDIKNTQQKSNNLARLLLSKAEEVKDDERNYYPIDYDFRGRIYARVPFISYQSSDAGRYLIRFADKTPIDNRTKFWLQIGIANAGGADKVCWDDRVRWFETNYDDIINVGQMFNGGNFDRAYQFLQTVEDPFCLAALADEYVKVFINKSQDYTQVYVYVDCSCSGTSIFNAWRLNEHGARMTNLIDTPEPADIYMEVWYEIKRLMPEDAFVMSRIKKLEKSKLLRKMMKSAYVPAQYASPVSEQHNNLKAFNRDNLKKVGLAFKDEELEILFKLWDIALDKVSSINSVVRWFQARTKEIIKSGKNEISYTTSNGSVMTLKYPKTRLKRVRTFHYGSASYRQTEDEQALPEVNSRKMCSAITANITHATDAATLCAALYDWDSPFVALHDAVGMPPGKLVDEGIRRLKTGLVEACGHPVWDVFRQDNNLPLSPHSAGPIIGDLDLEDILSSNYLYA